MKKAAHLIGLTGTNGAGKGEACAFFAKQGYKVYSLSDLIREELQKKGLPITRDNLIETGNTLREKFGPDVLARRVLKRISGNAVIDSIRNPKEVEHFRRQRNFILLAIEAPVEIRYERAKKRGREESASTLNEFQAKEAEEMSNKTKGQQLHNCMAMADWTIINDGSLEDFHRKLEKFI